MSPPLKNQSINVEAAFVEVAPVVEEAAVEVVEVPSEIVEVVKEPEVEAAIDAFEVAPMVAEVETTLDKMMEPEVEPVIASVILEEVQVPAHPLEAPQAAQTETVPEQSAEETAAKQKTPISQNKRILQLSFSFYFLKSFNFVFVLPF